MSKKWFIPLLVLLLCAALIIYSKVSYVGTASSESDPVTSQTCEVSKLPTDTPCITMSATPTVSPIPSDCPITPAFTPTEVFTPTSTPTEVFTPTSTPTEVFTPTSLPEDTTPVVINVGIVQFDTTNHYGNDIMNKLNDMNLEEAPVYHYSSSFISNYSFNIEDFDCLIIPGGPDISPRLYDEAQNGAYESDDSLEVLEIFVTNAFISAGKPVLGICHGLQLLNVMYGGTLNQDISGHSGGIEHDVTILGGLMEKAFGTETVLVNSYHHESIKTLGEGFTVTAVAADGTIEAIDNDTLKLYGVQWHPEYNIDKKMAPGSAFLKAFMDVVYSTMK